MRQKSLPSLLDILPAGVSIATDLSCKEIRHNLVAAEFLRIQPWENFSLFNVNPPAVKVMCQGRELLPEELPIRLATSQGKEVRDYELEFLWDDGVRKTAQWNASPLFDDQGNITGAVATFKDITEQKQADSIIHHQNAVLNGINRIFQEALTCDTEEELGTVCLAVTEELTQSRISFIGELDQAGRLYSIAISNPGWDACQMADQTGHRKVATGFKLQGINGRVLLEGKPFFTNDPASHPDSIGLPAGHPPVHSFLGVPLIHEGRTIGMIGLGNREGGYRPEDLETALALSPAIVQAFMRKRAEQEIRGLNEELEQRVFERTGELTAANQRLTALNEELVNNARQLEEEIARRRESELALQAAEQKTANILESISDAFYALDREWRFTYVNAEARRQFGIRDESEVIGRFFVDVFPNCNKTAYQMLHKAVSEQTTVRYEVYSQYSGRWHDVHAYPSPDGFSVYFLDITELKETQSKLQKSQQDISDILSSISDPFLALDNQWRITYVNQGFASYLGKPPSELLGQNHHDVLPNLANSDNYQKYYKTMAEKVPMHFEAKGILNESWYDINGYPRQDGIAIYAHDINEKKKLQQELLVSEERFRTAVENMQDCFGIYTAIRDESGQIEDFLIEYVNEAACKSNFMTREEQVGKRLLDLHPNYRGTGRFAEYCRVVETGEPHVYDALIRDVANVIQIVDSRVVKLGDGFTASWRDITERKKAEDALRLSEERFSKAFRSGPTIGVIRSLDDERIIDVNDTFLKTLEYERDEMIGHTPMELGFWADQTVFEKVFRGLKSKGECKDEEVELRTKSGKNIWALFSAFLTEINGKPCALINIVDITERKRMEEELRSSEQQLRLIMDTIPSRMTYVDSEKRYKYVNKAHGEWWHGVNGKNAQTKHIWEVIGEEAYHKIQAHIDTALSGERVSYEIELQGKDGEKHYFYTVMVPEIDDRGTVKGYISLSNDMTEFRAMEQKIAEALEFNQAILESSPLGIYTYNSSGQCIFANHAGTRISGGAKEQILQQNFNNFEHWKQTGLLDAANRVLSTEAPEHLEVHAQNIFGKKAWWDFKFSRFTSGGEPHLLIVYDDITERKEAEETLRQSEERFSRVFHSNPCQMAIVSFNSYRYIDVNQLWLDAVGFSREEVIGRKIDEVEVLAESKFQNILQTLLEHGQVQNYESEYINRTGEEHYVLLSTEVITINDEPCLLGAAIDITERKKYEKEAARLERFKMMGEIAGGIAHEIRNPMTVVRGYLQLLQEKEEFASYKKRFDTMIGEARPRQRNHHRVPLSSQARSASF